jgi:DedD protein
MLFVEASLKDSGIGRGGKPMEQKKLLGILISVGVFLVIVAATGLFIFYPKNPGDKAAKAVPAQVAAPDSSTSIEEPDEWVRKPETLPGLEPAKDQGAIAPGEEPKGDMVVVYGEKPALAPNGQGAEATPTASLRDGNLTVNVSVQPGPTAPAPAEPKKTQIPPAKPKTTAPKAQAAKTAAQAKPQAVKQSVPKKVQVVEYWIQAGSFKTRAKAEETKQTLSAKGLATIVSTFELDGSTYYRVRIGPYPSQPEANGWLAQIKSIVGFESSYVSKVTSARAAN